MDRPAWEYRSGHLAEINSALEEALVERCGSAVHNTRGRFHLPAGGSVWAEPAGTSVFVRVALPHHVVPADRWVPPDVSSSGEESLHAVAVAAAAYLAEALSYAPPSRRWA